MQLELEHTLKTMRELKEAKAEIERLRAALKVFACDCTLAERCAVPDNCRNFQARRTLETPHDRRAALVRKVCRAICQAENGPCDEPICVAENGCTFWTPHAVAAIDLIRAEVLEEAEDAVGEVGDCAEVGAYINAIRALKEAP